MPSLPSILLLHSLAATTVVGSGAEPAPTPTSQFRDASASASGRVLSPVGLFPIWENTAEVLEEGHAYAGSNLFGVGLPGRVQIGVNPLSFVALIPNFQVKVLLLQEKRLQLAAHAEFLAILPGAAEAFSVSNFAVRLTQPSWLVPVGATASWSPFHWLFLHFTATAQCGATQVLTRPQIRVGASAQAEFRPFEHHAFTVHAAEVGFYQHDFWSTGVSYRYQRSIFEGALGIELRRYADANGLKAYPAVALGVDL